MKTCWLNQQDNQDCIVFMAGWGMMPEPFMDIPPGSTDVLMVYNYRTMDDWDFPDFLRKNSPKNIHLLAWSMGVWTAAMLLRNDLQTCRSFSSTTAVGGTCQPIHDRFGIPEQTFDRTIRDLSPAALVAFYRSMFDNSEEAEQFLQHRPHRHRPLADLRLELTALRRICGELSDIPNIFKNRIVTRRDQIFPARNQMRAWGRNACTSVALPHFPFYQWSSWAETLKTLQHLT
ncbi:MAG: DUF452 family protein [Candidatus Electrothrix sp. AR4]|nr:DUF452 family protein [Candidatus Electrothrix sp. AR4]